MSHTLSPAQAGQIATRARRLRHEGRLTQHEYGLVDAMLWQARKPGSAILTASLRVLALLCGQGRSTVAQGVRRLEELGLIQRIRRRVRVAWGGSIASRVIANGYRLIAPTTESSGRTALTASRESVLPGGNLNSLTRLKMILDIH
jgi:hypothetical protein